MASRRARPETAPADTGQLSPSPGDDRDGRSKTRGRPATRAAVSNRAAMRSSKSSERGQGPVARKTKRARPKAFNETKAEEMERPTRPFPRPLLFNPHSETPLQSLRLSDWPDHLHPDELRTMMEINQLWDEVVLEGCELLTDQKCCALAMTCGPRLVKLDLSGCIAIGDAATRSIAQSCPRLKTFILNGCVRITDRTLRSISIHMAAVIETFHVENCVQLGDHAFISMITNCTKIYDLNVSGCVGLTDATFAGVGRLLTVSRMGLDRCPKLTDEGLQAFLAGCSDLLSLGLKECTHITDASLRALHQVPVMWGFQAHTGCSNLEELEITDNDLITDNLLLLFKFLPEIRRLRLIRCSQIGTSEKAMLQLGQLKRLEHLSLEGCYLINDESLTPFTTKAHKGLTELDISCCPALTDTGLKLLLKSCRHVHTLSLSWGEQFTDQSLQAVVKYNSGLLKSLKLVGLRNITDRGIGLLLRRCRILEDLDVSHCLQLTARGLHDLYTLRKLKSLDVSACPLLTDATFKSLPPSTLKTIKFGSLPNASDDGLRLLSEATRNLEEIDMSSCPRITDDGVLLLSETYPELRSLETNECDSVSPDCLQKLSASHPYLRLASDGMEQASGLRLDAMTVGARVQDTYYKEVDIMAAAASRMQFGYHQILERRVGRVANRRLAIDKRLAVISVQMAVRGFRARKYFRELKQKKTTVALMMQAYFRLQFLRRRSEKAKAFNRILTMKRALIGWYSFVNRFRELLDFDSSPERVALALAFNDKRIMRHCFDALEHALTLNAVYQRQLYLANEFWVKLTRPRLFHRWSAKAARYAFIRHQIPVVFMNAVALNTWNSSRQLQQVSVAVGYNRLSILSWIWVSGFRVFFQHIVHEREQNEMAEKHAEAAFFRGPMRTIYNAFREFGKARKYKRQAKMSAIRYCRAKQMRGSMRFWHEHAAERARKRREFERKVQKAMKFWSTGLLNGCVRKWIQWVHDKKIKRENMTKATEYFHVHTQFAMLRFWHRHAAEMMRIKIRREELTKYAHQFFATNRTKQTFLAWKVFTKTKGDSMAIAIAQGNRKLLKNMMYQWKHFAKHSKIERQRQEEERIRMFYFATKIQAIWRSKQARRAFQTKEIDTEFAALKIQAQFRMRHAIKVRRTEERHRTLRWLLQEERELVLMADEEKYTRRIMFIHSSATKLTAWSRGCICRIKMGDIRYILATEKGKLWAEKQREALHEAELNAKKREKLKKVQGEMSIKIQKVYRGHRGRRRFQFIMMYRIETAAAMLVQRMYRGRRDRRRAGGEIRGRWQDAWIREARGKQASMLRGITKVERNIFGRRVTRFGFGHRKQQRLVLRLLKVFGLDPMSFQLNVFGARGQVAELTADFHEIRTYCIRELKAFIKGGFDMHEREDARRELKAQENKGQIVPGDSVLILEKGKPTTSMTGCVISFDKSQPGKPVAEIRVDKTQEMAYHQVISEGTQYDPPSSSMYRISKRHLPPIVNLNVKMRNHLLMWAKQEAPKWEVYLAARTIQKAYRQHRSLRVAAKKRFYYWNSIRGKRLAFLGMLDAVTGVASNTATRYAHGGLAWELRRDNFEDWMPPSLPRPPKLEEAMTMKRHRQILRDEMKLRLKERKAFVKTLGGNMPTMTYMNRYRKLNGSQKKNGGKAKWRHRLNWFYKPTFWRLADKVAPFRPADFPGRKAEEKKILMGLAKFIGGRDWAHHEDAKTSWAGQWSFDQFLDTPHVRISRTVFYHGVWKKSPIHKNKLFPHGEGLAEFLNGFGVAKEEKVLKAVVIGGRGLKAMDLASSDPYVVMTCNRKTFKTQVKKKTLTPVWHELFECDVTDPDGTVCFNVYDFDLFSSDDFMGGVEIMLKTLKDGKPKRKWFKLFDVKAGGKGGTRHARADRGELELQLEWAEREEEEDVENRRKKTVAAVVVQCWARRIAGKLASKRRKQEIQDDLDHIAFTCVQIQCAYRCRLARRDRARRKRNKRLATKIQCCTRQWISRRKLARLKLEYWAGTKINSCFSRKRIAWLNLLQLRLELLVTRHYAALVIQCLGRRKIARGKVAYRKEVMIELGKFIPVYPRIKGGMAWFKTYGRDPVFGSKRLRRLVYRCFDKILIGDAKIALVTFYGDADIAEYPVMDKLVNNSFLKLTPTTDPELNLRDESTDFIRVKIRGFAQKAGKFVAKFEKMSGWEIEMEKPPYHEDEAIYGHPKEERKKLMRKAPKHKATLRMDSIDVKATINRCARDLQCLARFYIARLVYLQKLAHYELACMIQRIYKKRFAKKTRASTKIQAQFRRGKAHQRLVYKKQEVFRATEIQCAWRQWRARRAKENARTVLGATVTGTSSDLDFLFSGEKAADPDPYSFWCSEDGKTTNQWIMFDMQRRVAIGILRIIVPNDTSAPKNVVIQTADSPFDKFKDLERFKLDQKADIQSVYIEKRRIARFWRLYITKNHGSTKNVSINNVRFLIAAEESLQIVGDPKSVYREEAPLVGHRGKDIVLECKATGWPLPTYQWKRRGRIIPGANEAVITLRVQIPKTEDAKLYRCVHCRKVNRDLSTNIYRCICQNCSFPWKAPEVDEAKVYRNHLTEQDREIERILGQLERIRAAVADDRSNMEQQLYAASLQAAGTDIHSKKSEEKTTEQAGANEEKDEAAAEADNKDQGMSIMDTEDNETAETAKQAIDWEPRMLNKIVDEIPLFCDQMLFGDGGSGNVSVANTQTSSAGNGSGGASVPQGGDDEDEDEIRYPCYLVADAVEAFLNRRMAMDKRKLQARFDGITVQLEILDALVERAKQAWELLLHEKMVYLKDDPVKLHYEVEGIYTCVVNQQRGTRELLGKDPPAEGPDGVTVTKKSRPNVVLLGDPPPLNVKVTADYTPHAIYKRKKWPHYSSVHGYFSWGQLDGDVVIRYDDGDIYAGPYVHERYLDNWGYTHHSGRDNDHWGSWLTIHNHIFEGPTVDNHFNTIEINGTYRVTYPTGEIYEGEYVDNHRHGVGEFFYNDGSIYEGQWFLGVRQGMGSLVAPNGSTYDGEWDHDQIHGDGTWKWPDGSSYIGKNLNGKRAGQGVYMTDENDMYFGEFKDNQIHGMGVFKYNDGSIFSGTFAYNKRIGAGTFIDPRGVKYIGKYRDDKRHGEFIIRRPVVLPGEEDATEDEVQLGLYDDGAFIEWLSEPVNPMATVQFCDLFEQEVEEYDGFFALMIARRLPNLPFGVQPDHERVIPIVERIRKEGGTLVAVDTYADTLKQIQEFAPTVEKTNYDYQAEMILHESELKILKRHEAAVNDSDSKLAVYKQHMDALKIEIEAYFETDPLDRRRLFREAAEELKPFDRKDMFEIRHYHDPPAVLAKCMQAICEIMKQRTDWKSARQLLGAADQNRDDGDEGAAYADYEVKLIFMLDNFDVWQKADDHVMLGSVASLLADPRLKADHYSIKGFGKVLPKIVKLIWASIAYIKYAKDVKPKNDQMVSVMKHVGRSEVALHAANEEMAGVRKICKAKEADMKEAERLKDKAARKMQKLQDLLKKCQDMVVEYNAEEDHELDMYEQKEVDEAQTDGHPCRIVLEMIIRDIERWGEDPPQPEVPEPTLLEIINKEVPARHDLLFEEPDPDFMYEAGKMVALKEKPMRINIMLDEIVDRMVTSINIALNEDPECTAWTMLDGKRWTKKDLENGVHGRWHKKDKYECSVCGAKAFDEAFPNEGDAPYYAVVAKTNWVMSENAKAEARIWAEVHPEEIKEMEREIAGYFEEKYPNQTGREALRRGVHPDPGVRLETDQSGGPEDVAWATCWLKHNPIPAKKALEEHNDEEAKTFATRFPENTANEAVRCTSEAATDPKLRAGAVAWMERHMGEAFDATDQAREDGAAGFDKKFAEGTALKAVRAIRSDTAPEKIKHMAGAWSLEHPMLFKQAEKDYLVELLDEDKERIEQINDWKMLLEIENLREAGNKVEMEKKESAYKVATKGKAKRKGPPLNKAELEGYIWDMIERRKAYNDYQFHDLKEKLRVFESDNSWRTGMDKMRPSDAAEEIVDRREARDLQIKTFQDAIKHHADCLEAIEEEVESVFPTPEQDEQWEQMYDQQSGQWYWYNHETGEAQW